jgi:hypothetical protein
VPSDIGWTAWPVRHAHTCNIRFLRRVRVVGRDGFISLLPGHDHDGPAGASRAQILLESATTTQHQSDRRGFQSTGPLTRLPLPPGENGHGEPAQETVPDHPPPWFPRSVHVRPGMFVRAGSAAAVRRPSTGNSAWAARSFAQSKKLTL